MNLRDELTKKEGVEIDFAKATDEQVAAWAKDERDGQRSLTKVRYRLGRVFSAKTQGLRGKKRGELNRKLAAKYGSGPNATSWVKKCRTMAEHLDEAFEQAEPGTAFPLEILDLSWRKAIVAARKVAAGKKWDEPGTTKKLSKANPVVAVADAIQALPVKLSEIPDNDRKVTLVQAFLACEPQDLRLMLEALQEAIDQKSISAIDQVEDPGGGETDGGATVDGPKRIPTHVGNVGRSSNARGAASPDSGDPIDIREYNKQHKAEPHRFVDEPGYRTNSKTWRVWLGLVGRDFTRGEFLRSTEELVVRGTIENEPNAGAFARWAWGEGVKAEKIIRVTAKGEGAAA